MLVYIGRIIIPNKVINTTNRCACDVQEYILILHLRSLHVIMYFSVNVSYIREIKFKHQNVLTSNKQETLIAVDRTATPWSGTATNMVG